MIVFTCALLLGTACADAAVAAAPPVELVGSRLGLNAQAALAVG
jgi:hypothetical protein